jgi:predicted  nucleic acid-binding Zn-ribbon protein
MADRLDKIMQIAEELSHTRSRVEGTMVNLKTQLISLRECIELSITEIEQNGVDSPLRKLANIQERATGISRNIKELKQQSASLEQALGYIKAAKRLSST